VPRSDVAGSRDMLGWGDFLILDVRAGLAAEMSKSVARPIPDKIPGVAGAAGSEHDPIDVKVDRVFSTKNVRATKK